MIDSKDGKEGRKQQLYDLEEDPGETNDISAGHPEIAKRLAAALAKARADGRTRPIAAAAK